MWHSREHDRPVSEEELSAFADGELPPRRARRVAAHLRAHPTDADRIHDYWRREAAILQVYASLPEEHAAVAAQVRHRGGRQWPLVATAATALIAAVWFGGVTWQWRGGQASSPDFASVALRAYARPLEGDGGTETVSAPAFPGAGLTPFAHKQLQVADHHIEEYRYRSANGEVVALYAMQAEEASRGDLYQIFERGVTHAIEWRAGERRPAALREALLAELAGVDELEYADLMALTQLALRARSGLMAPSGAVADGPKMPVGGGNGSKVQDAGARDSRSVDPPTGQRHIPVPVGNGGGDT